jgi:hypothetical protein
LVSETIYVSFRENQGQFWVFPQPPPVGITIVFEYASRNWVLENGIPDTYADEVNNSGDIILFEPYLFERLLKTRFLEARGFDSTAALQQYQLAFKSWSGKDKGAPILSAGRNGRTVRYLNPICNTPDTGYGG